VSVAGDYLRTGSELDPWSVDVLVIASVEAPTTDGTWGLSC
jgi:hypothetical protein